MVCMVWLFQFGTCGFELLNIVWYVLQFLSASMCGMAVTIWSTCGIERKYVWYGCNNLVNL